MEHATVVEDVRQVSPRAVKNIVLCVIFLLFAASAVFLRVWARRLKGSSLYCNDYAVIAGLVGHSRCVIHDIGMADFDLPKLFEIADTATIIIGEYYWRANCHSPC